LPDDEIHIHDDDNDDDDNDDDDIVDRINKKRNIIDIPSSLPKYTRSKPKPKIVAASTTAVQVDDNDNDNDEDEDDGYVTVNQPTNKKLKRIEPDANVEVQNEHEQKE